MAHMKRIAQEPSFKGYLPICGAESEHEIPQGSDDRAVEPGLSRLLASRAVVNAVPQSTRLLKKMQ